VQAGAEGHTRVQLDNNVIGLRSVGLPGGLDDDVLTDSQDPVVFLPDVGQVFFGQTTETGDRNGIELAQMPKGFLDLLLRLLPVLERPLVFRPKD
jgi:hypothetical protein